MRFISITKLKLLAGTILMLAMSLPSHADQVQVFTNLYSFSKTDGSGGVIQVGDRFYGAVPGSGTTNYGAVFTLNLDGTGFTNLYRFTGGADGADPSGMVAVGQKLYGTALKGGNMGRGTIFALNLDGTGFTTLHTFTNGTDGEFPQSPLAVSGDTLYGTTSGAGFLRAGTLFALKTDGTGFTNFSQFSLFSGFTPYGGLLVVGNTLYGTTANITSIQGTVFAINTDGTGFTNLHTFFSAAGAAPEGSLIMAGQMLYGTAYMGAVGGSNRYGMVFAINTNGTGFTVLHNFNDFTEAREPLAGVISVSNTLYGLAYTGGTSGVGNRGAVFALHPDGTGFYTLHTFMGADGANPIGMFWSGNALYGETYSGGANNAGTIFALPLPADLFVAPTYYRLPATPWQINVNDLLTNVFYFADAPYSLASVGTSTNGIVLTLADGYLQYVNLQPVDDQFSCTVTNSAGNSLSGTITLVAATSQSVGGRVNGLVWANNKITLNFSGVGGLSYAVQVSTNLMDWTTLTITNAPDNGLFQYLDAQPAQPAAYYRLLWQGN